MVDQTSRRRFLAGGIALLLRPWAAPEVEAARPRYRSAGSWGGSGTGAGRFDGPRGVAARGDAVYVADSYNNRIQQFTRSGKYVRRWWSYGTGNGQFNRPRGVAVSTSGQVYVADTLNHRIQIFSSSGGFIRRFGGKGTAHGKFADPWGVAIGRGGRIYVAD